jgi:hypothetical protein
MKTSSKKNLRVRELSSMFLQERFNPERTIMPVAKKKATKAKKPAKKVAKKKTTKKAAKKK